jgi:hypothetical protein
VAGDRQRAETLYAGQQHLRLMKGISAYRAAGEPAGPLRFRILSALHGLIDADDRIAAYDHSFVGMRAGVIREEGVRRGVPASIRAELAQPFAVGLLLLGDPYIRACDLTDDVRLGGPLISFCSPAVNRRLPRLLGLRAVPLANPEAHRFSCGLSSLKGELGAQLLMRLARDPQSIGEVTSVTSDLLDLLEGEPSQLGIPVRVAA